MILKKSHMGDMAHVHYCKCFRHSETIVKVRTYYMRVCMFELLILIGLRYTSIRLSIYCNVHYSETSDHVSNASIGVRVVEVVSHPGHSHT